MRKLVWFRLLLCWILLIIVTACGSPESKVEPAVVPHSTAKGNTKRTEMSNPQNTRSQAKNLNAFAREIAIHISQQNAEKIYVSNPQALLRSVVVLKFTIDANGSLVSRDLVRSNKDKETEGTAMQSLARAQPFPLPPSVLLKQGKVELLETWLFNSDGRFQLRTIALPQRGD